MITLRNFQRWRLLPTLEDNVDVSQPSKQLQRVHQTPVTNPSREVNHPDHLLNVWPPSAHCQTSWHSRLWTTQPWTVPHRLVACLPCHCDYTTQLPVVAAIPNLGGQRRWQPATAIKLGFFLRSSAAPASPSHRRLTALQYRLQLWPPRPCLTLSLLSVGFILSM